MLPTTKKVFFFVAIFVAFLCLGYFISNVFNGNIILPQSFLVGPLKIHYYGIIMALAVGSAFYLAMKRAPKYGLDNKTAEDLMFWLIIGGFIGARLYHVFSDFGYYRLNPIDAFKVWNGGLSIYGAVLGGIITLIIYHTLWPRVTLGQRGLVSRLPLDTMDWLAPSLVLGQIIGRFGNFFNYEAFGYPTNLPWKMFVPPQFRPPGYQAYNFFHPFFLYEAIGNAIILYILLKFTKVKHRGSPCSAEATQGKLFFLYLLLYNSLRFGLEFLRIDSTFIGPLRLNAVVSLILVLVSAVCLVLIKKRPTTEPK